MWLMASAARGASRASGGRRSTHGLVLGFLLLCGPIFAAVESTWMVRGLLVGSIGRRNTVTVGGGATLDC